jgi:hypothetical protein
LPIARLKICLVLVALTIVAAGCASDEPSAGQSATTDSTTSAATSTTTERTATDPELVGLWRRVNRCSELVGVLQDAGLGDVAFSVVGDFFPEYAPEELATKEDLCEGAEPIVHYHFFDAAGGFGSLDENQDQVDGGMYEIIDDGRFRIDNGDFEVVYEYEVDGDTLTLAPEITDEMIAEALADPSDFTAAGWSVSVSYPGQEWNRVPCESWC